MINADKPVFYAILCFVFAGAAVVAVAVTIT